MRNRQTSIQSPPLQPVEEPHAHQAPAQSMIDFDWQQLRQLAGEDVDFETELLAMFLTDADDSLSQLEEAIASKDIQSIEEVAHSLRGASANVGAIALANIATKMEQAARSGQTSSASNHLKELRYHAQSIRTHFKAQLP